jgi:hypothetical protein
MSYYFFFSYARLDVDPYLKKFYKDLAIAVRLKGLPNENIGFFDDEDIQSGRMWPERLANALQTSRVFVPLYSPTYFAKEYCGKEWRVFSSRLDEYSRHFATPRPALILPVLWVPEDKLPKPLPRAVSDVQYKHDDFGDLYARGGLRLLIVLRKYRDRYQEFLDAFADKLIHVGDLCCLPPLDNLQPLNQIRSAWEAEWSSVPGIAKPVAGAVDTGFKLEELPTIELPKVFVSYAWGDTSSSASEEDRQRQEVVERLCETVQTEGWQVLRDKTALRYGDMISTFMKTLGQANLVIVVLSAKYLRSPYCVTELYDIYRRSLEKEDFLRRIIPLALADAQIDTWRDRVAYAQYWEAEFKAMEQDFRQLGEADLKLYKAMRRWHNEVGDMLAYVNDVLHPHGFENIEKGDFAALRQMLTQRR